MSEWLNNFFGWLNRRREAGYPEPKEIAPSVEESPYRITSIISEKDFWNDRNAFSSIGDERNVICTSIMHKPLGQGMVEVVCSFNIEKDVIVNKK